MWKILACAIFAVGGIVAVPAPARAEPSDDTKLAEDLAQQAFEAYARGEFLPAITLYKKAHQISSAGVILFNIANIYDKKLKDKEQALDYYQRYLRSGDTEPDLVKRTSERIDVIRADIEASKQVPADDRPSQPPSAPRPTTTTSPSSPPPPVAEPRSNWRIVGLAATGVGVAGLALGSVYGLIAKSKNDQASEVCTGTVCPDQRGLTLTNDANQAARISTVSFIIGGALVVGGVGLFLYAPKKADRLNRTSIRITPQLGGLAISGVWQ